MSRGAQLVASLVLALFGIGLAAAAMEAGVRVLHLVPDRFWQPDPLLGTELIPGKEGWWTQEEHEFIVPVRINSLGHRDIERPRAKPAGNRRILVIGDSHVEALQVPLEDAIFRRLESELAETADDVEVLGAGVSGYGTASQLLFFRDRGWKLEPDLVILAFYPGNDIKNNGPALEKALVPHYGDDGGIVRVDGGKPRSGGRSLLSRSKAYVYFRKLILTRQPGLASFLADIGLMQGAAIRQADAPQGVPLDYWVYAEPTPPEWAEAWRHTIDTLATQISHYKPDLLIGIESRGFLVTAPLALKLGCGFAMIRKKGKLPYRTISETYQLEYGVDEVEIHEDAFKPGENVLLVDDLIATGGTAIAGVNLIERGGGNVKLCSFVVDLPDLGGAERLRAMGKKVSALIAFEGE